jgi:stage V sporulation protein S
MRVSSRSDPRSVAAALAAVLRANGKAKLAGIEAGAVSCTVKATTIARGYVEPQV